MDTYQMQMRHMFKCLGNTIYAHTFASLSLEGLMQARQPSLRRFHMWQGWQVGLSFCGFLNCWISYRQSAWTVWNSFDAITWGESDNSVWMYPFTCNDNREACMTLGIKLHTLAVTLSSMTLRVLNLVQLMNWRLLGSSLKRSLQKLSWKTSCMQFGILLYPLILLFDLSSPRYCIPMDSPRPILPAELEFFNKGTGRGKS